MKNLLIIALIISSFAASAQNVVITPKFGQKIETKIIGSSSNMLYYSGGSIFLEEIQSVDIKETGKSADALSSLLAKNNIPVTVQGSTTETINQTILATQPKEITTKQLAESLEEFRIARQGAKGMQAAGIITIAASIVMQSIYIKQYNEDIDEWTKGGSKGSMPEQKNVAPVVPALGASVALIGFGLDIGAGGKLKIKR